MRKLLFYIAVIMYLGASAQTTKEFLLIARNTGEKQLANGEIIRVFGFAEDLGTHPPVPGPTLVVNEGDSVHIDLWNISQGAPHTIHLHGLDVNQQNDGVPHLSFEVEHMKHGIYRFKAPHAGTYLYHCHVVSTIHVQAGMYGTIIVKPSDGSNTTWNGGLSYDREQTFVTSEIDTFWHQDSVLLHPHGDTVHQVAIPVYKPQFFLVNGSSDNQLVSIPVKLKGAKNEQIYLRFVGIGYYGNTIYFPPELNAKIVASDGRPLPSFQESDSLTVLPGERYGVMVNPKDTLHSNLRFDYFDLNTGRVKNSQEVAVEIVETAAVPKLAVSPYQLVPNPFKDKLILKSSHHSSGLVEVEVRDALGKLMWHKSMHMAPEQEMELDGILYPGVYFVTVLELDGRKQWVQKVLKY